MSPCLSSLVAIAIYATGVLSLPAITGRPPTSTSSWHDNAVYGLFTGRHYQSTPLNPPHDRFGKSDGCDSGYTFIGPHLDVQALTIVDGYGQLVWMADRWGQIRDFRLQEYRGQDYITFWNAALGNVNETGTYYMLDSSYETAYEIHPYGNVTASNPYGFEIFHDSALMTVHRHAQADLSPIRGPRNARILNSVLQEIDIATGKIVFQWSASEYFGPRDLIDRYDSHKDSSKDIFHINSVDKDDQGNYILLFRYLRAVVCVSPDGDILWILGGKRNSFLDLSEGAATRVSPRQFAKWQPGNVIHLVESDAPDRRSETTASNEGLKIALDPENITAALIQENTNTTATASHFREPPQPTSSGNTLAGYKHSRPYTESSASGGVSCEAAEDGQPTDRHNIYRKFKGPWKGRPKRRPDVAIRNSFTNMNVYVSWNGATDVRSWRLETAGDKAGETILDLQHRGHDAFAPLLTVPRAGFETKIQTKTSSRYVRVVALDDNNVPMGSSIIDTKTNIVVMYNSSRLQVSNTAARDITLSWLVLLAIAAAFYQIWKRAPTRHSWQNTRLRRLHDLAYMKRDDIPWSKVESHYHRYLEPSPTFRAKARSIATSVLAHPLVPRRLRQMFARYPTGG